VLLREVHQDVRSDREGQLHHGRLHLMRFRVQRRRQGRGLCDTIDSNAQLQVRLAGLREDLVRVAAPCQAKSGARHWPKGFDSTFPCRSQLDRYTPHGCTVALCSVLSCGQRLVCRRSSGNSSSSLSTIRPRPQCQSSRMLPFYCPPFFSRWVWSSCETPPRWMITRRLPSRLACSDLVQTY
jgi:hypothetical protein